MVALRRVSSLAAVLPESLKEVLVAIFTIGASYNPYHTVDDERTRLPLPKGIEFVELGLRELSLWNSQPASRPVQLSLHLARSPICEALPKQRAFISHLADLIGEQPQIISIGLHITGPRHSGIGRYGFSSHYEASEKNERQAIDFIRLLQDRFRLPVWIENANFYSRSSLDALSSWESIHRVCDRSDALLIADLSHLLIDARNADIDPIAVMGMVPWSQVIEIHLSGIVPGFCNPVNAYSRKILAQGRYEALRLGLDRGILVVYLYIFSFGPMSVYRLAAYSCSMEFQQLFGIVLLALLRTLSINFSSSYSDKSLKEIHRASTSVLRWAIPLSLLAVFGMLTFGLIAGKALYNMPSQAYLWWRAFLWPFAVSYPIRMLEAVTQAGWNAARKFKTPAVLASICQGAISLPVTWLGIRLDNPLMAWSPLFISPCINTLLLRHLVRSTQTRVSPSPLREM